ncbi:MAG: hypothetical protein WC821_00755 [archaeon]|jgi:hypothetical protein
MKKTVSKKIVSSTPPLKGYSLPSIAKFLSAESQQLMHKRGQLMIELRENPLEVYESHRKEILALLSPKERTAPLRAEVKNSVMISLTPKKGSYFPSPQILRKLTANINSFSEKDLIGLLKLRKKMSADSFRELILNSSPRQLDLVLK